MFPGGSENLDATTEPQVSRSLKFQIAEQMKMCFLLELLRTAPLKTILPISAPCIVKLRHLGLT